MKTYLDKLKDVYRVCFNGEYVVIPHTKLHILRPDGTLVACRSDLRYAGRITFLSGNRMLLSSSKHVFHMIDLTTGEDLWTTPYTKCNLNINPFAISPNEKFAYTYDNGCDKKFNDRFISQLDLETHEVEIIDMYLDAGATMDICCEDESTPCLLKTRMETVGGKNYRVSGVRLHDFFCQEAQYTNNWKTKWYQEHPCGSPEIFFGSTDQVVTSDLKIFTPATGEMVDLLENETEHSLPQEYLGTCWLDHTGRYLCLRYMMGNVVIDTQERKIAAAYAGKFKQGCLIGSEYWIGTDKGVARKPFPALEEIPPYNAPNYLAKLTSEFYSKRPELW